MTFLHRRQSAAAERGATILEFLIYVAIVASILVTITRFAAEFAATQSKAVATAEVTQNARWALARMEAEIRNSTGINVGSSTFGSSPGTLSISTSTGGTNPTVFAVSNGALTVSQGGGQALPLTGSRVNVLEFQVDNVSVTGRTRAVRLHLRLEHVNTGNAVEFDAETTVESTVRIPYIDGFGS